MPTQIQFPPEMQKMLDENPDLEVLHVSVVFDKTTPLTKKWKKKLANDVYQAALDRLEELSKIQNSKGFEKISPKIQKKALPKPNPKLMGLKIDN